MSDGFFPPSSLGPADPANPAYDAWFQETYGAITGNILGTADVVDAAVAAQIAASNAPDAPAALAKWRSNT